jgi:hypothetical protein
VGADAADEDVDAADVRAAAEADATVAGMVAEDDTKPRIRTDFQGYGQVVARNRDPFLLTAFAQSRFAWTGMANLAS